MIDVSDDGEITGEFDGHGGLAGGRLTAKARRSEGFWSLRAREIRGIDGKWKGGMWPAVERAGPMALECKGGPRVD